LSLPRKQFQNITSERESNISNKLTAAVKFRIFIHGASLKEHPQKTTVSFNLSFIAESMYGNLAPIHRS
jgi:hypothetical protein